MNLLCWFVSSAIIRAVAKHLLFLLLAALTTATRGESAALANTLHCTYMMLFSTLGGFNRFGENWWKKPQKYALEGFGWHVCMICCFVANPMLSWWEHKDDFFLIRNLDGALHFQSLWKLGRTYWKFTLSTWNFVSKIPEVNTRQRSRSWKPQTDIRFIWHDDGEFEDDLQIMKRAHESEDWPGLLVCSRSVLQSRFCPGNCKDTKQDAVRFCIHI